jgi:hypothetical protein
LYYTFNYQQVGKRSQRERASTDRFGDYLADDEFDGMLEGYNLGYGASNEDGTWEGSFVDHEEADVEETTGGVVSEPEPDQADQGSVEVDEEYVDEETEVEDEAVFIDSNAEEGMDEDVENLDEDEEFVDEETEEELDEDVDNMDEEEELVESSQTSHIS